MTMPQEKWRSKTVCKNKKSEWAFKEDRIKTRIGSALVTKVFEKNFKKRWEETALVEKKTGKWS